MRWYALFVKTGKEDEVCGNLKKLYEFFNPMDTYEVIVPKGGFMNIMMARKIMSSGHFSQVMC